MTVDVINHVIWAFRVEAVDCGWIALSLIGVDPLSMVIPSVVMAPFVFTRFRRSSSGLEMSTLAFMSIITADRVALDTGVGFNVVPAVRSVVKKYRRSPSTDPLLHSEARILTSKERTKITMNRLVHSCRLIGVGAVP